MVIVDMIQAPSRDCRNDPGSYAEIYPISMFVYMNNLHHFMRFFNVFAD